MQRTATLTGQDSVRIFDIFNWFSANISGIWNAKILGGLNLYKPKTYMCKYRVDQNLKVLMHAGIKF